MLRKFSIICIASVFFVSAGVASAQPARLFFMSAVLVKNDNRDFIKPAQAVVAASSKDDAGRKFNLDMGQRFPGYSILGEPLIQQIDLPKQECGIDI